MGLYDYVIISIAVELESDGAMVGLGGNGPPNLKKYIYIYIIIIYMSTNFSNFVLKNYTFAPFKISLILLKVLL